MTSRPLIISSAQACLVVAVVAALVAGSPVMATAGSVWAVGEAPMPAASQTSATVEETPSAEPVRIDPPQASPVPSGGQTATSSPFVEPGVVGSRQTTGTGDGTELMFVGTVVNQGVVVDPTVTLTDVATGRELGSASTTETGDFSVSLEARAVADVQSIGVMVSGTTTGGEPVSAHALEAVDQGAITPQRATQDSLLVMVDTPQLPGGAPEASVVLESEASVLEVAHTPAAEPAVGAPDHNSGSQTQYPRTEADSRLQLTGAGARPAVIVGFGLVAVATLGAAMVVAGRRRRS